jgi:hypothetical protein
MRIAILFLLALGCGDDDGGSDAGPPRDAGGGMIDAPGSVCTSGCASTLAAACSNGPATQAICEADCEMLRTGSCGAEYEALLSCGEGGTVTCDASGRPTVTACSAEQSAFVMCLGM